MKVRLSAPSKTFLLGEYFVLQGGSALVLSTKPRFTLNASRTNHTNNEVIYGVHPSSPAGRYFAQNSFFNKWQISFSDPHDGLGGFGASSAQFLLLFCLGEMISTGEFTDNDSSEGVWPRFTQAPDFLEKLWSTYQEYSDAGSGADVLAQLAGQVTHVNMGPISTEVMNWPFPHHSFALVRTGRKLATHTHLKAIKSIETTVLAEAFKMGRQSFENKNVTSFIEAVNTYQEGLRALKLVAPESLELIEALQSTEAVTAVKGCGAMGADVLFVMYKADKESVVRDRLNLLNLPIVATSADLTHGLKTCTESTPRSKKAALKEAKTGQALL
jgi:mevalonate kinase